MEKTCCLFYVTAATCESITMGGATPATPVFWPGEFHGLYGPWGHKELWASLVAQRLKHLPAMRDTWVRSLGWEDPLEKEMATHSSILAWIIPWTEELGGLQSTGSQRVGHD